MIFNQETTVAEFVDALRNHHVLGLKDDSQDALRKMIEAETSKAMAKVRLTDSGVTALANMYTTFVTVEAILSGERYVSTVAKFLREQWVALTEEAYEY